MSATATIDSGGETLGVDYSLNAAGVSARPLLAAFAGADNLSGILDFSTRGTTAGASPAALVSALNGDGALTLTDGALEGIELEGVDIAGMLYRAMAAALDEPEDGSAQTVFESVGGSFTMRNGEIINEDMTARAPLFSLSGSGRASLPRRTLDYRVVAALAAQAGGDNILAGIPVPVTISGPWSRLEYKVAWERILEEVASDPARVAALPAGLAIGAAELGIRIAGGAARRRRPRRARHTRSSGRGARPSRRLRGNPRTADPRPHGTARRPFRRLTARLSPGGGKTRAG